MSRKELVGDGVLKMSRTRHSSRERVMMGSPVYTSRWGRACMAGTGVGSSGVYGACRVDDTTGWAQARWDCMVYVDGETDGWMRRESGGLICMTGCVCGQDKV